jgi:hypothetical protein
MNREYVEADRRIVLGFIKPHFMAGFSGGYKGVIPAMADIDSIMHYHRASVIGHACSTWGVLEDNPTQNQIRANGSLLPVDFLVNVTINRDKEITGHFCGEVPAVDYYLVDAGDGVMISTSIFESASGEEESNWRAGQFIGQYLTPLMPNPPHIAAGEAVAHTAR